MSKRSRNARTCRRISAAALAMSVVIASMPAYGDVESLDGSPQFDGTAGSNGTPANPVPGPGGDAMKAIDLQVDTSDTSNTSTARGANGGVGGIADGTSGIAGGHGGAGGEASATASGFFTSSTIFNSTDVALAIGGNGGNGGNGNGGSTGGAGGPGGPSTAVIINGNQGTGGTATADGGAGGNGGTGGAGGSGIDNPGGPGGAGGAGGSATTFGQGPITSTSNVLVTANAVGGAGGTGGTGGAKGTGTLSNHVGAGGAGGAGGSAILGAISAAGANMTLDATLTGGLGGNGGNNGAGALSGAGGNGGNESVSEDSTFGSTTGGMQIYLTLIGGAGGSGNGTGGNGGSAATTLTFGQSALASLVGVASNFGGAGGNVTNGVGGSGGGTSVFASGSAPAPVEVTADANITQGVTSLPAGQGGDVTSGTGTGGAGGSATAGATGTSTGGLAVSGYVDAIAEANAGNGGNVTGSATGVGGAGGNYQVTSSGSNSSSSGILVDALAQGGAGGQGNGAGFAGGVGGTTIFTPTAAGTSTGGGGVSVNLQITGGAGGPGINGASGGRGAAVILENQVSGSTSGSLTLSQSATGGNGGSADGASAGAAGDASSTLEVEAGGESSETISANAGGGSGGSNQNANGGNSGDATALSILTNGPELMSTANVNGSKSGGGGASNSSVAGFKGGDGGTATANASAVGTSASLSLSDITAQAYATGPAGGNGTGLANGGNGGLALASAAATGNAYGTATADASATGGPGGTGAIGGVYGNALSDATATENTTGRATASAIANAGAYGVSGTRGSAYPTATAYSPTDAEAGTFGQGASGTVTATAHVTPATPGLIAFDQSTAIVPVDPVVGSRSSAYASYNGDQTINTGASSSASLNVNPEASDVASEWSGSPSIQAVFGNNATNVSTEGVVFLDRASGAGPGSETFSADLEMNLNSAFLTGNDLVVAMVSGGALGENLYPGDTIRFRIERGGVTLVDQTYGSTVPNGTLNGTIFDLGPGTNSNPAEQDVQVLFDLTSVNPDTSVINQFLFGNSVATSPTWQGPGSGTWTNANNWQNSTIPAGPGTSASINGTTTQTITLDESTTLGAITFNNSAGDSIVPGASSFSLTLDNAGSPATINVTAGNHTISAPLLFTAAGLAVSVRAGSSLSLSALSGPGALTLDGPGVVQLLPSSGAALIGNLVFSFPIAPGITGGAAPDDSASPTTLDITNNPLIVEATNPADKAAKIAALQTDVQSGESSGTSGPWTGVGVTSSTVAADAAAGTNHTYHTVVAIADNGAFPLGTSFTSFGGQPVDANSIIVVRALAGDANLDGTVNNTDLVALLTHFTLSGQTQATGDYNGDGTVNNTDLVALLTDYDQTLPGGFSIVPAGDPSAGTLGGPAPVPEPASLAVLLVAAPCLMRRRRRNGR